MAFALIASVLRLPYALVTAPFCTDPLLTAVTPLLNAFKSIAWFYGQFLAKMHRA
ncbi:hypothetical protein HY493_01270 [Candidatus Woesearchaeota archaeon]|nr:hypothetical protein [Candidatus Woesearchaeota archaeon]